MSAGAVAFCKRLLMMFCVATLPADLGLQAGAANAEPMQVDAVTRSPSPSKAALGSKERAQMPVAVTPRDQDITAAAGE